MPRAALNRLLSLLLFAGAIYTHAAEPAKAKAATNPPPGIAIPDTDRAELMQECERLRGKLDDLLKSLASAPEYLRLLPDVQVLHKAVWYR